MKIHYAWFILGIAVAGAIGVFVGKTVETIKITRRSSHAGQTLVDLARALESEKRRIGSFPDSITNLNVEDSGGDFSSQILKEIIYMKTESGFIAFVGLPEVAYIAPGVSTQYK